MLHLDIRAIADVRTSFSAVSYTTGPMALERVRYIFYCIITLLLEIFVFSFVEFTINKNVEVYLSHPVETSVVFFLTLPLNAMRPFPPI